MVPKQCPPIFFAAVLLPIVRDISDIVAKRSCTGFLSGYTTFMRREGQLQQISVFAFSLNLNKHCKLE